MDRVLDLLEFFEEDDFPGFVTQCDFTGDILWHRYVFGFLGLPIYRFNPKDERWRKFMMPGVMSMVPVENSDHYDLEFSWLKELLRSFVILQRIENVV